MKKFSDKFRKLDKKLSVEFSGEKVILPDAIQKKVDAYWEKLLKSGKPLRRGEGYHITDIIEEDKSIKIEVSLSDYAHYIYSRHIGMDKKYAFKNIHTSCLIETNDDYLIIGVMGQQTAIAGNVQCVGGGIDNDDLRGKRFDLRHNIKNELREELGLDAGDKKIAKSLKLGYIKYNKHLNTIAAIFILKLKIDAQQLRKKYEEFEKSLAKKSELPEFGKIFYLKKEKKAIEKFIKEQTQPDHYLKYLLREMVKS